ncbi:hypothetical protein K3G39_07095 [Pontibacter sp. HSC-14F20]|uniref:hypothetical protein n=1 Tax=Pontibacter sp. HSC-14F20 TaxID=2864136 RepID=UPI001C72C666|nr:hypothetical protein [Pontibacter sp. HSC-14F20]MBX0333000.1 hypothetical protein [Pontibacter sp. HSC-14F20]
MLLLLEREVLQADENSMYCKTYDTVRDLYGIHSFTRGTFLEPEFLHIFPYKDGLFVVVDQLEQYYGIDLERHRFELSPKEAQHWKSIIIKSSTCSCVQSRSTASCTYCSGDGTITNTFGMKLLDSFFKS